MNLQHLPDIHTGRHTQWVQNDIKRPPVWKEWHILHWKNPRNNTLITMTPCHLIANLNLTFLGNIYPNCFINTRRKLIAIFPCKHLCIYNYTKFTMWHFQRSITHFSCFLPENRTKKPLFCCQLCLTLRCNLTDQDITCSHFRANSDNSSLIQVL